MGEAENWVMISVAADRIGIHRNTLKKMCDRGEVSFMRVGSNNYRKFHVEEIERIKRETRFSRLERNRITAADVAPEDYDPPPPEHFEEDPNQTTIDDHLLNPFRPAG